VSPSTLAAVDMYQGVAQSNVVFVGQKDHHEMVRLLLDGSIKRVREAKAAVTLKDFKKKSELVTKAQKIIFGLRTTLDFEKGGEIAINLHKLYDYCLRTLTHAHTRNDLDKFSEVEGILEDLLTSWIQIRKQVR